MALTLEMLGDHGPVYGPGAGADLPGVVILHGSEGPMAGWSHRFAAILAGHGVLALPWGYGAGDFWGAGPVRDVDIRGAVAAAHALDAHPRCRGAGLFGWSKGGELALILAALAPDAFRFVAAHAASDRVMGAFDPDRFRSSGSEAAPDPTGPRAWTWPGQEDALTPGAPIPIETYPGPVFLSVGTEDDIRDPAMTRAVAQRLEAAGRPPDLFEAEGEGHALSFGAEPALWARLLSFIEGAV